MAPKRTKGAEDFDPALFVDTHAALSFKTTYNGAKLFHEYHLDESILTDNLAIVSTWLQSAGLYSLLTASNDVYPEMLAYFYANLSDDNILHARSFLKGKRITINGTLVSRALNVPDRGTQYITNYEHLDALRVVLNNPEFTNAHYKIHIADLDAPTRVLHLLITHSLLPRTGSHANITVSDLGLLYFIKSGLTIHFSALFLDHLVRKKATSPYPVFLSRILVFLQKVSPNDRLVLKQPQSHVNIETLKRCKIYHGEAHWFREHPQFQHRHHSPQPQSPPSPSHPETSAGPSSSYPPADPFETNVLARLDILTETQLSLLSRLDGLAASQSSIMAQQRDILEEQRRLHGRFDDALTQHEFTQNRLDDVQQHMQDWMTEADARWFQQFPPPSPSGSAHPMDDSDAES